MNIDDNLLRLICDIEYRIGSKCYNPNSYDGFNNIEGCSFRYPVSYVNESGGIQKSKSNLKLYIEYGYITEKNITSLKYRFGSNELRIGRAIIDVLTFLENRYNINFSELERKIKE